MSGRRRIKVARELKYRSPGMPPGTAGGDGDRDIGDDGGTGVREPRRPLPPTPLSGAGAQPLPESFVAAKLPNPPER